MNATSESRLPDSTCPAEPTLQRYLTGELPEADAESTSLHLETCPRCLERLASLRPDDSVLVALKRHVRGDTPVVLTEEATRLTERLRTSGGTPLPVAGLHELLGRSPQPPTSAATPTIGLPSENTPQPPTEQAFAGKTIGRYRLLRRLGAGGMGTVYLAEDPHLGRPVAIKLPHFGGPPTQQEDARKRFLREARVAAAVRHSNVCPIYDVGEHEGTPYVVMAYIEGCSLAERLGQEGRLDDAAAVGIAVQLAAGLGAVHECGLVHRDLKPANVLLDKRGGVYLADFGLARPLENAEQLSLAGSVVGTPAYMAPEQAAGDTDCVGPQTDLYSLGVILYQMLTGRLPFADANVLKLLHRIAQEAPPTPSQIRPNLDPRLEAIVLRALARRPEDRFASAGASGMALRKWLNTPPSAAAPTPAKAGQTHVKAELPDGNAVNVTVHHPGGAAGKVAVKVIEQTGKRKRSRRLLISVTVALALALVMLPILSFLAVYHFRIPDVSFAKGPGEEDGKGDTKAKVMVPMTGQKGAPLFNTQPRSAVPPDQPGPQVEPSPPTRNEKRPPGPLPPQLEPRTLPFPVPPAQVGAVLNADAATEIVVYQVPPPAAAGLSLRMDHTFTYGPLCIVLDCSGSMNEKLPGQTKTKIELAREALGEVLRKLPSGTYLSIAVFGHEPKQGRAPKDPLEGTRIEWLRKVDLWGPQSLQEGLAQQLDRLRSLAGRNLSPVAEALKFAKEEGFPPPTSYNGPRQILVLTDGDDNLFENGLVVRYRNLPAANRKDVPTFLKNEFQNSDIQINIVCLGDLNSPDRNRRMEAKNTERQFGAVTNLAAGNSLIFEPRPVHLAKTLLELLIRPRLLLRSTDDQGRFLAKDLDATAPGEELDWRRLEADSYKGTVQGSYRVALKVSRGQLLNVVLHRDGSEVLFRRGLFCDQSGFRHLQWNAWHVSVPQNEFVEGKVLRQLVAIEREQEVRASQAPAEVLRQVSPDLVWLELKAQGRRRAFHWQNEYGYAAPTYRLTVPDWAGEKGNAEVPELEVWWSQLPPFASPTIAHAAGAPLDNLKKGVAFTDNVVTITSTKTLTARLPLALRNEKAKLDVVPCLRIEMTHAPGKPVWLRAEGLEQHGEEHRFSPAQGKYTALFWGVSNPEATRFQLKVISLEMFKNDARQTGHAFFRLSRPDAKDNGEWLPRVDLRKLK
jgi:serine/threonine protein kinase